MEVKEIGIPPRVFRKVKPWHYDTFACRRCGFGITEAEFHYCPNCGHKILHASYAGACGWSYEDAENKMKEILSDKEKQKLLLMVREGGWLYQ